MARIRLRDLNPAVFLHSVGIGVESPSVKLDVDGAGKFSGRLDVNHDTIKLYNSENTNNTYFFVENTSTGNAGLKLKNSQGEFTIIANDRLRFISDDSPTTEVLSLHPDGKVGVGSVANALSHPFEVWHGTPAINLKDTSSSGQFRFQLDGVKATIKNHSTNGDLELLTTGTGNIVLSPAGDVEIDGKVGVGTGSGGPNYKLHIADATSPQLVVEDTTNNLKFRISADDTYVHLGSITNTSIKFLVNNLDVGIWDTNGRLGVGTTSFGTSTGKLFVGGEVMTSAAVAQFDGFIRLKQGLYISDSTTPANYVGWDIIENSLVTHAGGSGTHKVGIGTGVTVGAKLVVQGDSDDGDADCGIHIIDSDPTGGSKVPNISFRSDASTQLYQIRANDSLGLQFRNSSDSTKVTFDDDGNVGIGVSEIAASTKLHIKTSTDHNYEFEEVSGNLRFSALNDARDANMPLQFAASEFKFLTGDLVVNEKVGIGTGSTAPSAKLDVTGGSAHINAPAGGHGLLFKSTDADSNKMGIYWQDSTGAEKWRILHDQTANETNDLSFYSAAGTISVLALRQDGKVGIGTGSSGPAASLDVISADPDAVFLRSSHATATNVYITNTKATANNTANLYFAPANNVVGALIQSIAIEDFSTEAKRTADLTFSTRKNGTLTSHMRISADGKVGIGTGSTALTAPLTVYGPNDSTLTTLLIGGAGSGDPNITFNIAATDWTIGVDNSVNDNFVIANGVDLATNPRVSVTTDGKVGIKTAGPEDYYYNDLVVNAGDEGGITIVDTTSGQSALAFGDSTDGQDQYMGRVLYDHSTDVLRLGGGGEVPVNITDTSLGIGTPSTGPIAKLDVGLSQTANATDPLDGDSAVHFGSQANVGSKMMGITLGYREDNALYRKIGLVAEGLADSAARQNFHILVDTVNDNGSVKLSDSKFTINGLTGNVGINDDGSQNARLRVVASGGGNDIYAARLKVSTTEYFFAQNTIYANFAGAQLLMNQSGALRFGADNAEVMRLKGGKVGIGTGSTAPDHPLTIHGDGGNTYIKNLVKSNHQVGLEFNRTRADLVDGVLQTEYNTNWIQYIPSSSTDLRFYNGGDKITLTAGGALTAVGNIHTNTNLSAGGSVYAAYLRTSGAGVAYAQLNDGTLWLGDKGSTSNFGAGSYPSASWGGIDHAYDVLSFGGRSMKFWSSNNATHKPAVTILKQVVGGTGDDSDDHNGPGRVVIGSDTLSMSSARLEVHGNINLVGGSIFYDSSATDISTGGGTTIWQEVGTGARIYYNAGIVGIGTGDPGALTGIALQLEGGLGQRVGTTDSTILTAGGVLDNYVRFEKAAWFKSSDDKQRLYFVDEKEIILQGHDSSTNGPLLKVRDTSGNDKLIVHNDGALSACSVPWGLLTSVPALNSSQNGLAPQLPSAHGGKFLKADGSWEVPAYTTNTNTWIALSASADGYVTKHPNDTAKFLRGDGTWATPAYTTNTDTWNALGTSTAGYVPAHGNDSTKFLRGDGTWATPAYIANTDKRWDGSTGQTASTVAGVSKILKTNAYGELIFNTGARNPLVWVTGNGTSSNPFVYNYDAHADRWNFTRVSAVFEGGVAVKPYGRGNWTNSFSNLFQDDGTGRSRTKVAQLGELGIHSYATYSGLNTSSEAMQQHWGIFVGPTWNADPYAHMIFGGGIASSSFMFTTAEQAQGGLTMPGGEFNLWVQGTGTSNSLYSQKSCGIATPYMVCGTVDDKNQKMNDDFGDASNPCCDWLHYYDRNAPKYKCDPDNASGSCIPERDGEGNEISAGLWEFGLICLRNAGVEGNLIVGKGILSDGILAINPDNSKPDTSGIVIGNGKTSLPVTTASDQILGTNSIFGINESGSLIVEYENIEMRDTATADKKMRFYVNGDSGFAGDTYYISDRDLKEEVETISEGAGLSIVNNLRGVTFNWRKDAKQNDPEHTRYDTAGTTGQVGFIAQEVEEVCPNLVAKVDGHKAINLIKMLPILVEAIKEQNKAIETLKEEVENLKNNLENN